MKIVKITIIILVLIVAVIVYLQYPKLNMISGYAAKNMAWWLGAFPMMLYLYFSGGTSFKIVVLGTFGLVVLSFIYYLRAITEEKHLSIDPAYREYCETVKYRFIPGVL